MGKHTGLHKVVKTLGSWGRLPGTFLPAWPSGPFSVLYWKIVDLEMAVSGVGNIGQAPDSSCSHNREARQQQGLH